MDKLESLLESYYGMQDEEAAAKDAHDMDSSAFSVAEVASDVVASKSLPELLTYKDGIERQTRHLDHEMQQLVYNNYNRFISATDTIRKMKTSVAEMESKMDTLVTDMRQMGGSSELVNESLQENRGKIEKLVGVKRLLVKLEFLFELPVRLKRAIELDAQGQAVRYYSMVIGVLRKHDHIPSLHKIRVEADAIINGLRAELRGVLKDSKASTAASSGKVVEAIRLLVQLEEPRPALRAAFLAYQRTRLLASLRQHTARYPPVGGAAPGAAGDKAGAGGGRPADASSASLSMLSATAQAYYSAAVAARSGAGGAAAVGGSAVGAGGVGSGGAAMLSSPRPRASVLPYPWMQQLDRSFIDSFRVAAEMYAELFEGAAVSSSSASGSGAEATAGGDSGDASGSGTAAAAAAAAASVSPEERRAAHEELLAFAKDCFGDYFAVVRGQLSLAPPRPGDAALAGLASPGGGLSPAGGAAGSGHAPSASAPSGLGADSKARAGAGRRTASTAAGASAGLGAPGSPKLTAGAAAPGDADVAAAERAKRDTVAAAMAMSGVGGGSGAGGSAGLAQGSGGAGGRFDSMVEALKLFLSDVRSASRSVPAARLSDRAQEVTEAVLRAQLDGLFSDVRADVVSGLGRLRAFAGALVDEEKDRAVRAAAGAPLDGDASAAAAGGSAGPAAGAEGGSGGPAGGAAAGAGGVLSAASSGARGAGAASSANPFALPAAGAAAASDAAASAAAATGNPFAAPPAGGAAAAGHARRPSGNPFALGGDAAGDSGSAGTTASANPFAAPPGSSGSSAPAVAAAAPFAASSASSARGKPAAYDWLQVVGSGLSSAAETSSSDVSARIDAALQEAKPLVLSAMRLLPDLARVFNSLVHGQVITLLSWLASAWEAQADPMHPCRAEFAAVVVEADLGLEREAAMQHGGGGGAGGGRNGTGRPPSTSARGSAGGARPGSVRGSGSASSFSASAHASALKRRVIVNFAAAEGGDALGSAAAVAAAGAGSVDARSAADAGAALGVASPSSAAAAAAGSGGAGPVGQQAVERQQAFLLLLAVVCRHFATNGVARALSTMLTTLPSRAELATMGLAPSPLSGGPSGGSAGTAAAEDAAGVDSYGAMMDVPDLIRRVQAAGRALLRAYVKGESARLSAVIRRAMTSGDWLRHAEPRGARLFVRLLIEDAAAVRKLVAVTLRDWDARAAVAAALAYGVGSANITAASSGASSSGVSAAQQQEGGGVAGGSRRPSSNPFADASAASGSRLTATAGNPFAAPPPASAAAPGGARGSIAGGAVGGLSGAGASGTGHNAAVVSAAQAARRTGMVVGALGAPGVSAGGAASTAGPFGGRGFGGAGGGSAGSRMSLGMGLGMGASHDIDRLFHAGDEGGMMGGAGGGPMSPGSGSGGSSLVLGWIDYSSTSVVRALLRVLCKALVEWVRAVTFGREGFQQVQVDIAALHLALPFLVGPPPPAAGGSGGSAGGVSLLGYPGSGPASGGVQHHDPYQGAGQLEELLAEAAVSAAERCLAPAPLEMSIVHALASEMLVGVNLSL